MGPEPQDGSSWVDPQNQASQVWRGSTFLLVLSFKYEVSPHSTCVTIQVFEVKSDEKCDLVSRLFPLNGLTG